MNLTSMGKSLNFIITQVQALEGLGQENSRLAAYNEAILKQLSGATSSVRLSHLSACLPHYACRIHREDSRQDSVQQEQGYFMEGGGLNHDLAE